MIDHRGHLGQSDEHKRALEWVASVAPYYAPLVPESGARLITIAGAAQIVAKVFLAPGAGLNRCGRRRAEAHPRVACCVRGDPGTIFLPAPDPSCFGFGSLRWAIRNAERIAIWSAPFPELSDKFARWGIEAAKSARFITTIETTPEQAAEWADFVHRWKQHRTSVELFGPAQSVGGVA